MDCVFRLGKMWDRSCEMDLLGSLQVGRGTFLIAHMLSRSGSHLVEWHRKRTFQQMFRRRLEPLTLELRKQVFHPGLGQACLRQLNSSPLSRDTQRSLVNWLWSKHVQDGPPCSQLSGWVDRGTSRHRVGNRAERGRPDVQEPCFHACQAWTSRVGVTI